MTLTRKISLHNFYAFLWHAGFLALAHSFMDVDTVIPAMLIESGGKAIHVGIMTAIMMGGSSFTQLFFAPYLSNRGFKKKFLLLGINSRVFSIFALGAMLFYLQTNLLKLVLGPIFLFITLFSLGGAFANISYTDILGKSVDENKRKQFFSVKQIIVGSVVLISAFLAKRVLTAFEYPINYSFMFFIGAFLLLIASAGFWKIKEISPSFFKIKGIKQFFRILRQEWSQNKNLSYFLGFINTQSIMLSFLPFVILYAKEILNAQSSDTGYFLLFKVIGVVTAGTLVFFFTKRLKYHPLLYLNVALSIMLILLTLYIKDEVALRYIFIMGGVVNSLYLITMNGLLLEVSGNGNRALYAGFAGAGNILPAIFPLTGSWIIGQFGFRGFFILFMLIVSSSAWFIYKIDCNK